MDRDRIIGSAKDLGGKVEGAVGDITGDARTQASGRLHEAAGSVQNVYGQAKDAARDVADTAASYVTDDGPEALVRFVRKNPLGALASAAAAGFALAVLMRRPASAPNRYGR